MRNRNYFRIEELSDVTKVTLGDLKHAIENEGLSLYAWIRADNLGYVSFWNQKGVGQSVALRGHFAYKGLIKITPDYLIEVSSELADTAYWEYSNKKINLRFYFHFSSPL